MPHMTEPARRHRCEMCNAVFECHLCTIHQMHQLHGHIAAATDEAMFVCEDCSATQDMAYVHTENGVWNYQTGRLKRRRKKDSSIALFWSATP